MPKTKIFLIAGEASGDLHGANLINEWKKLAPNTAFVGWGGDKMASEGMLTLKHIRSLSFMGFIEVLLNIRTILRNIAICKEQLLIHQPDVVVLIDFPGFNLRIAKWLKQHNIPVIFYISPQIWAWKASRVHAIGRDVSKMYCILPFEKAFYLKYNVDVQYLGHPLLDEISKFRAKESTAKLSANKPILALLPGSRSQEVKRKLPLMLDASKAFPDYLVVVACSANLDESFYRKYADSSIQLVFSETYEILNQANLALVTSGTATLETALFGVPQVVCYKSSVISYQIAKALVKIKFISLVNLIMDDEVVTELIQNKCTAENMRNELRLLALGQPKRDQMLSAYQSLTKILGSNGASSRVANDIVVTFFSNRGN